MSLILEIQNLQKQFGKNTIVNVPEFFLSQSESIAIKGESGSGKSTFLNLCAGILKASRGCIKVNEIALSNCSESERDHFRAKNIGYLHQQFLLLQGFSALENLMIAMKIAGHVDEYFAYKLLEELGISHQRNRLPKQMSVGEKQRLAIARALVNKPSLLLADEPTASLDDENSAVSIELLQKLSSDHKTALLVVTHDTNVWNRFTTKIHWREINQVK